MKRMILNIAFLLLSISSIGQILYSDTGKFNCNFYQGILVERVLDSGAYVCATSNHLSYIEFTLPYFSNSYIKYKVEKQRYDKQFFITKVYQNNYDSTTTCFIAIDSTVIKELKKKGVKSLEKQGAYMKIQDREYVILQYIFFYLSKNNIQSYFLDYDPKAFVAWFKLKG